MTRDDQLPPPPPEAIRALRRLYASARVMSPNTDETMAVVTAQLAFLGLIDEPVWRGMTGSVGQFAYAAASMLDHPEQPAIEYLTEHAGLLARADVLQHRFRIRPMPALETLRRLQSEHRKESP